ncbi:hypothetical protein DL93DRAFT_2076859 [Clavulina sp. PMI_390]|nr:hypothetical protein DL93DRAFT_2076859 [Clavulina sp. PMI_390]
MQRKIHPEWAESFFIRAQLPDDWKRETKPITLGDVNAIRKKMQETMAAIREAEKAK